MITYITYSIAIYYYMRYLAIEIENPENLKTVDCKPKTENWKPKTEILWLLQLMNFTK